MTARALVSCCARASAGAARQVTTRKTRGSGLRENRAGKGLITTSPAGVDPHCCRPDSLPCLIDAAAVQCIDTFLAAWVTGAGLGVAWLATRFIPTTIYVIATTDVGAYIAEIAIYRITGNILVITTVYII